MTRSHPPTLLTLVERTLSDELDLRAGDLVMVAVSGGPDSMALLHALAKLLPRRGVHLVAHAVDHGLRPEAVDELALAARFAHELGVPFTATSLEVVAGANLMARARDARYAALRGALAKVEPPEPMGESGRRFLATGHHADDRAETALIRLLRGSGPAGLAVLPARSADLIRPLIRARRSDVLAHITRHRIACCQDPTNRDPKYLRSRVRADVLPLLRELSPHIVEHLCALADALGQESEGSAPTSPARVPAELAGVRLGRAQRVSLERAFQARNTRARIPLRGGAIARVDLTTRKIVLTKDKS
jgi:tRNA(Ile)-lysidine synthase